MDPQPAAGLTCVNPCTRGAELPTKENQLQEQRQGRARLTCVALSPCKVTEVDVTE